MSPERWKQIEDIFNSAIELSPDERAAFLARACGSDAALRSEVERLLGHDAAVGDFIASPVPVSHLTRLMDHTVTDHSQLVSADQMIGRQVGAYRLEREIGRGGMGAVYLATRADNEFYRRVAIKLVKRGMDSDSIVRRFRHERQILASFDHPNIARLLDGGTTEDGRPWFAMEYIEGEPVTRWCDERQLSIQERLRLFLQVCAAVQYAHQRQVIHRDIKPGNILVTADGTPKLLDFGIARILDPDLLLDSGELTIAGIHPMTPEYASPEQVRGEPVTPASDQYALGVLLYELLAGRRPYRLRHRHLPEIAQIICEEIPERPSVAFGRSEASGNGDSQPTPEVISARRHTTPDELRQALAAGPDDIVLQALQKQPSLRYASVSELAEDISRHLQGLPVAALPCPVSTSDPYETGLISRASAQSSLAILPLKPLLLSPSETATRNFLGVGLADALITRLSNIHSLTVRPTASVLRYSGEDSDALTAGRELNVSHVLDGRFLQSGDRIRVTVQLINVQTAAPQWAAQFDKNGADLLELQDSLSEQLVQEIARNLTGEERAQIARRGTDHPEAYEAYLRGRYHWHTHTEDGMARAITCFYEAIALDPNFAAAYSGVADYFNWMGITSVLPPDECFLAAKEAATRAVQLDDRLAEAWTSLAIATWAYDWDTVASNRLMRQAIELNANYAQAHQWLAQFRSVQGRHPEAIAGMKHALEIDPQSPARYAMMAFILHNARQHQEAYQHCQRALEIDPNNHLALQAKAWIGPHAAHLEDALNACRRAVEITGRAPLTLWALAYTLAIAGRRREARAVFNELLALARRRYVPHYFFARIHTALGEYDQAFDRLGHSFDDHESWAQEITVDPQLDPLRSDPRFARLIARIRPRHSQDHETETLVDAGKSVSPTSGRLSFSSVNLRRSPKSHVPLFAALAVVFICLIGWFAWLKLSPGSAGSSAEAERKTAPSLKSIAVLPFKTDSGAEADQSLGVGLADALGRKLGQVRQLSVRPPSALRQYLTSDITPQQAAAEQKVDYVVSGRLRREGEMLRLELQLFGTQDGAVLMNVEMNGPEAKLVSFQNALAERLLRELKFEVTGSELLRLTSSSTENNEAYQQYLVGRYHFGKRSISGFNEAIKAFNLALERDDKFALAYAGLADCYNLLQLYQGPSVNLYPRAKENALKALALDESLAEAHSSLAYVSFYYDRDRAGAEREFRRAIELNPGYGTAHHWYAHVLAAQGRRDEALAEIRLAEQLDPRSPIVKTAVGLVWFYARDYNQALAECRRALELDPGLVPAHRVIRWIHQAQGRYDEALGAYQQEKSFSGFSGREWPAILAQIQAIGGRRDEALTTLTRGLATQEGRREAEALPFEVALAYALIGDHDQALRWMERAEATKAYVFNFAQVDPRLDELRTDPRFVELLRKAGL